MTRYLAALALVLALAVWNYYPYLYPAEPTPPPVTAAPASAPADESSPGYIGTIVVNGIEVRLYDPATIPPPVPQLTRPDTKSFQQTGSWMNSHSAWAGLTSAMFGPLVAIAISLVIWMTFVGGRRLMYRRI